MTISLKFPVWLIALAIFTIIFAPAWMISSVLLETVYQSTGVILSFALPIGAFGMGYIAHILDAKRMEKYNEDSMGE